MDVETMINEYNNGLSLNEIAKKHETYPTTVRRILKKNHIELRHDAISKGKTYVKNGEKLIEWAKAQGHLVTKAELAKVIGKTRLSHSYFIAYPELGQYVTMHEQNELNEYTNALHKWLQENNILYKPNDKKTLGVTVSALLLEPYKNIVIQIDIKPRYVSKKRHEEMMLQKLRKANEIGVSIIFLKKEYFENLNCVKDLLDNIKYAKKKV